MTVKSRFRKKLWEFASPWMNLPEISGAVGQSEVQSRVAYLGFYRVCKSSWITWYLAALAFAGWAAVIWPNTDKKIAVIVWLSIGAFIIAWGVWVRLFDLPPNADKKFIRHKEVLIGRVSVLGNIFWGCAAFTLPSDTREFDAYYVMTMMWVTIGYMGLYALYRPGMLWGGLPPAFFGAVTLLSRGDSPRAIAAFLFSMLMIEIFRIANTSGKMIEAALISEEEKRLLSEELHIRRIEAEAASLAKSRFLTAASHDLRQPISSAALLLAALRQSSSAENVKLIDRIEHSVQSMDSLLGSVLEASTIASGAISISVELTDIESLLAGLKDQFELQAREKNIQLTLHSIAQLVVTDKFQLQRVLSNLLSNAIRYTKENGKVCLRCRLRHGWLWVQVWDSGIGIHPQEQKAIFNEFYQVTHAKEEMKVSGLGLGLYIVKRITQELGHPLLLRSRLGRGSVFSVRIPCASFANSIAKNQSTANAEFSKQLARLLRGLLVFIIEDDVRVLEDMQIFFTTFHCHVLCASSYETAEAMVLNSLRIPDLIVSDYRLNSTHTGVDAIKNIRTKSQEHIPALLITAEYVSKKSDYEKFQDIPIISKPINFPLLAQTLSQLLQPVRE
jgi:two-component system, sensor histidine kinase